MSTIPSALRHEHPILIPSKGRPDARLPRLLDECELSYALVVEPQDEAAYRQVLPSARYIVLPENDRGLSYARQQVLTLARDARLSHFWLLDDNVRGFYRIEHGKCLPCGPEEAFGYAEWLATNIPRAALVGLQYQQFAWNAKVAYQLNRYAYCCVLVDAETGIDYRPEFQFKSDVAFCLDHLTNGWRTVLVNKFAMNKPVMGANSHGGQSEGYKLHRDEEAARLLCKTFPRYATIIQKTARIDARVDWGAFSPKSRKR